MLSPIDLFSLNVCFPKRSCLSNRSHRFFSYLIHAFQKGEFCPKTRFEASRAVVWSLSGYQQPFTDHTVYGLLIAQTISFQSSGMRRMQNFAIFAFSHFFRFSCFVFCFHFCWAISRLDFIGKRFLRSS